MVEEIKTPKVEWVTLSESTDLFATTFLFYGGSGVGKSHLLSQFPDVGILATDPGVHGGVMSGRKYNPRYIKIKTYDQLIGILPKLEEDVRNGIIRTVGIDSVSYLQKIVMAHILQRASREQPRFDEWGLCVERMRNLINRFADLPCYTVMTATENIKRDEVLGKMIGGPNLPGQLATELPQACDVMCRLFVVSSYNPQGQKVNIYKFQSTPDEMWVARDRTDTLPPEGIIPKEDALSPFKHLLKELTIQQTI